MKKYIGYSRVLLREYCTYPPIYFAAVLFVLLCAFGPAAQVGSKEYSVLELLTSSELFANAVEDFRCSSYDLMMSFNSSPWFEVVMPVIAAFPALAVYEQNAGASRRQILVRISKRSYSGSLFFCAFVSGFLIALTGILLYTAVVQAVFPPLSAFPDDTELINAIYGSTEWERLLPFLKKVVNCCVICGIFPVLTMTVYQLIRDQFLAITLPMMIQYVSLKGSILYGSWLYSDESRYSNRLLSFIHFLFPSSCMRHYYYWENNLHLPFVCFFAMAAAILAVLYLLFDRLNRSSIGEGL